MLHFDECQDWATESILRKKGDEEILNEDDYLPYSIISLTRVMERSSINIRYIFTGTNTNVAIAIKVDSATKLMPMKYDVLPVPTKFDVERLLDLFIDVSSVDSKIITRLVGPIRICQFFLMEVYSGCSVEDAVSGAYQIWKKNQTAPYNIDFADSLVFFYLNYQIFGGIWNEKEEAVEIPSAVLSHEWKNWSNHSLINITSLSGDNTKSLIYLPFPFLAKYIQEKSMRFDFNFYNELHVQLQARWTVEEKGQQIFQFLIPLELQFTQSPLWQLIINHLNKDKKDNEERIINNPELQHKIKLFKTDEEAKEQVLTHHLSMSIDPNAINVKTGDISFPLIQGSKVIKCRGEVKLCGYNEATKERITTARNECITFFEKAKRHPDIDVAIFFCWIDLNLKGGKQTKNVRTIKKYLEQRNYIIIDCIHDMDNLILNFKDIITPKANLPSEVFCKRMFKSSSDLSTYAKEQVQM